MNSRLYLSKYGKVITLIEEKLVDGKVTEKCEYKNGDEVEIYYNDEHQIEELRHQTLFIKGEILMIPDAMSFAMIAILSPDKYGNTINCLIMVEDIKRIKHTKDNAYV